MIHLDIQDRMLPIILFSSVLISNSPHSNSTLPLMWSLQGDTICLLWRSLRDPGISRYGTCRLVLVSNNYGFEVTDYDSRHIKSNFLKVSSCKSLISQRGCSDLKAISIFVSISKLYWKQVSTEIATDTECRLSKAWS